MRVFNTRHCQRCCLRPMLTTIYACVSLRHMSLSKWLSQTNVDYELCMRVLPHMSLSKLLSQTDVDYAGMPLQHMSLSKLLSHRPMLTMSYACVSLPHTSLSTLPSHRSISVDVDCMHVFTTCHCLSCCLSDRC